MSVPLTCIRRLAGEGLHSPAVVERGLGIHHEVGVAPAWSVLRCWITLLKVLHTSCLVSDAF